MDEKAVHILEQVSRLYYRYGIKSVTMEDVAKKLCISKKTLYSYFSDKEALVKAILMLDFQRSGDRFREVEDKNLDAITEILGVFKVINDLFRNHHTSMEYDVRKYYPDLYHSIKMKSRERMYSMMNRNLKKGKREGLYRRNLDTGIISRLQVIRAESILDNDLFKSEELVSDEVFQEIFVYHMQGILSEKGRIFFEKRYHGIIES